MRIRAPRRLGLVGVLALVSLGTSAVGGGVGGGGTTGAAITARLPSAGPDGCGPGRVSSKPPSGGSTENGVAVLAASYAAQCTAARATASSLPASQPARGVTSRPVITTAAGDLVISIDTSAVSASAMQNALLSAPDLPAPDGLLSDSILTELQSYPLLSPTPSKSDPNWFGYHGSVQFANNTLSVTIPVADVHTQLAGWVIQIISGTLAFLAGLLAFAICTATINVAGSVVCKVVLGTITTFTWTLVAGALGAGTIYSQDVWVNAIAAGLLAAVAGTVLITYLLPWVETSGRPLMLAVGNAVAGGVRKLFGLLGNAAATAAAYIVYLGAQIAERLPQAVTDLARRAGLIRSSAVIRLEPLGDSITAGLQSTTGDGYRGPLYNELASEGHQEDFVGSLREGSMSDPDNEGHSGWRIDQIAEIATQSLTTYRPNVVTLEAGTNDLGQDYQVNTAPARLGSLIDQIFAAAPDTTVVVASLITNSSAAMQAKIAVFNAQVSDLVQSRQDAGEHVLHVDMSSLGVTDLADGLHPNDAGYQKMADVFNLGVEEALALGWVSPPVSTQGSVCNDGSRAPIWNNIGTVANGAGNPGANIQFADINGDGKADFLTVDPNTGATTAYLNGGPNNSGGWIWYPQGQIAVGESSINNKVVYADINGDGLADYLVVTPNGAIDAYLNGGPKSGGGWIWYPQGQIASGDNPSGSTVSLADINADGRADYLSTNLTTGAVNAYLNGGPKSGGGWIWYPQGTIANGIGEDGLTTDVQFADINCDRRADYLAVNLGSGAIDAYSNGGPNSSGGWIWYPLGTIASGVGAPSGSRVIMADLNGDGRADYLVVASDGQVQAWLN